MMQAVKLLTLRNGAHVKHAIKTGIAGVSCLYLSKLLKLPEAHWAVISAVLVMQSNVGATLGASWNRLVGTAIGAVVGGIFVAIWGASALAFGVAVTSAVLICGFLGLVDSYRLAGVTVAIVMLISYLGPAWVVSLHRFLEVSLGILVALAVTVVIWPSRAREHLREGIAEAFTGMDALFQAVVWRYRGEPTTSTDELRMRLKEVLRRNEDLRIQAIREPAMGPGHQELTAVLMDRADRLLEVVEGLELAARESITDAYYLSFEPELGQLVGGISAAFKRLAENVAAWHFDARGPDLVDAVSSLDAKAAEARKTRASVKYSFDEILRLYSFLLGLKNLARELDLAHLAGTRLLHRHSN